MARSLWPAARLAYQADDGKVEGLLLAEVAHRDHATGIDRAALQAQVKRKAQKAAERAQRQLLAQATGQIAP